MFFGIVYSPQRRYTRTVGGLPLMLPHTTQAKTNRKTMGSRNGAAVRLNTSGHCSEPFDRLTPSKNGAQIRQRNNHKQFNPGLLSSHGTEREERGSGSRRDCFRAQAEGYASGRGIVSECEAMGHSHGQFILALWG